MVYCQPAPRGAAVNDLSAGEFIDARLRDAGYLHDPTAVEATERARASTRSRQRERSTAPEPVLQLDQWFT
jgi:hypothetical protein